MCLLFDSWCFNILRVQQKKGQPVGGGPRGYSGVQPGGPPIEVRRGVGWVWGGGRHRQEEKLSLLRLILHAAQSTGFVISDQRLIGCAKFFPRRQTQEFNQWSWLIMHSSNQALACGTCKSEVSPRRDLKTTLVVFESRIES